MIAALGASPVVSLTSTIAGLCGFTLVALASGVAQPAEGRLTNAPSVRLRRGPSMEMVVVATLPFGSPLKTHRCRGVPDAWCEVTTSDGQTGWVHAVLTSVLDPRPGATAEMIVDVRQAGPRELRPTTVEADMEVLAFVEGQLTATRDADARPRWALYRLRAMRQVAAGIQTFRPSQEARRRWLERCAAEIAYNEPGGQWMVRPDAIARAYASHRTTLAADDIAWLLVENGQGGECEGEVPCYLARFDRLTGQYPRWRPDGRHAAQAVAELADGLRQIVAMAAEHAWIREAVDMPGACSEMRSSIAALHSALAAATVDTTAARTALDGIAAWCR